MQTEFLLRRLASGAVAGVLLLSLLAACGGDQSRPASQAEAPSPAAAPATANENNAPAEEVAPTEEVAADNSAVDEEMPVAMAGPATCTAVEIPDNATTPPPTAEDWAKGPADAALTLVEYGDFQ